jgi:prophage regulatory protein
VTVPDLVGAHEIAEILGVSRQRVQQLARTAGFPQPVAVLAMGKVWVRSDVEEWAARRGRRP